ncbi:MAG TPA: MBL fold metallo-hydrolase [Abditibacterium sp.]
MNPSFTSAASNAPDALQIESFRCGPLQNNAYLIIDFAAREAVIIDPSIESDAVLQRARELQTQGIQFKQIWNTHGHFDHVYDNAKWKTALNVPLLAHPADAMFLEHLREQALWFGLPAPEIALPDAELHEGQILQVGTHSATVLEVPGHSPGSVAFDFGDFLVSGDVLFEGSVGRTDLPGCSNAALAASVRRLFAFAPQTRILPGHGAQTTIEAEKRGNLVARDLLEKN